MAAVAEVKHIQAALAITPQFERQRLETIVAQDQTTLLMRVNRLLERRNAAAGIATPCRGIGGSASGRSTAGVPNIGNRFDAVKKSVG
jgi:hypothetical protein